MPCKIWRNFYFLIKILKFEEVYVRKEFDNLRRIF